MGFWRWKFEGLFCPESPGMKVWVCRSWLGRLIKPKDFATLSESIRPEVLADKGEGNGMD